MKKLFILLSILFIPQNMLFAQRETPEVIGDIFERVLPATAILVPLIIKDKDGTKQAVKTILTSAIITYSLKRIINKPRPNGGEFSFPSGHTSAAFSGAASIQRRYGWKYGSIMYAMAAYTGWSRVNANKHDYWDVLGGAAIGIGSAYLFTKPYKKQNLHVSFGKSQDYYVLSINYQF
jgi:hypothetical protein